MAASSIECNPFSIQGKDSKVLNKDPVDVCLRSSWDENQVKLPSKQAKDSE